MAAVGYEFLRETLGLSAFCAAGAYQPVTGSNQRFPLMTMPPMKDTSSRVSGRATPGEGETLSQTSFEFGTLEQKSAQVLQFPARSISVEQSFRDSVIKSLVRLRIISK